MGGLIIIPVDKGLPYHTLSSFLRFSKRESYTKLGGARVVWYDRIKRAVTVKERERRIEKQRKGGRGERERDREADRDREKDRHTGRQTVKGRERDR